MMHTKPAARFPRLACVRPPLRWCLRLGERDDQRRAPGPGSGTQVFEQATTVRCGTL